MEWYSFNCFIIPAVWLFVMDNLFIGLFMVVRVSYLRQHYRIYDNAVQIQFFEALPKFGLSLLRFVLRMFGLF